MINLLVAGLGSGLGALWRYALIERQPFKKGVFSTIWYINTLGTFLLGFIINLYPNLSDFPNSANLFIFLTVGMMGGFTTFSTAILEGHEMPTNNKQVLYFAIMIISGLLAVYAGTQIGDWIGGILF